MSTSTPARRRPPANRVSPRALRYWYARAGVLWGAVVLIQVIWLVYAVVWSSSVAAFHVPVLVASGVVGSAYTLVMPPWRFRVHRWEVTPHAVYTQTGWLRTERRIAPLSRVQTVDTEQGAVARLFGLAKVTVTTASAAGPLEIDGLDLAVAVDLVEQLTAATDQVPGDAT